MASPQQIFNTVAVKTPRTSVFDLSHSWKSTCDFAQLIPNLLLECLPGDVIKGHTGIFGRAMPMLSPVMHKVDVYQHYFFVPYRLIWDDYEKFLVPQDDETEVTIPEMPTFSAALHSDSPTIWQDLIGKVGTLADYLGIPPQIFAAQASTDNRLSILPFRAYQLIYNEYYRDQQLIDPIEIPKSSGVQHGTDVYNMLTLRYRAWEKDYFTSALPSPQKGNPIGVDLAGNLNVSLSDDSRFQIVRDANGLAAMGSLWIRNDGSLSFDYDGPSYQGPAGEVVIDPNNTYRIVGSQAYITIESLRQQARLQEYMELLMRGGSRYAEVVRNLYNVVPDDLRIGRPQYLGGGKQNLIISEVLQQSQSVANQSALGEMAGHGITIGGDNRFRALIKEHGLILGIMSVRPRSEYSQGVDRFFFKKDRYDFANPLFAHLGEQPVLNGELYYDPADGQNNDGFGYQPIYQEYRYKPSTVHGDLRGNLAFWTLARKFGNRPALNADFVQMHPSDFNEIFAVTEASDGSHLIVECEHKISALRCLPAQGIPTL